MRQLFKKLDKDGSGTVDMSEYIEWELRTMLDATPESFADRFMSRSRQRCEFQTTCFWDLHISIVPCSASSMKGLPSTLHRSCVGHSDYAFHGLKSTLLTILLRCDAVFASLCKGSAVLAWWTRTYFMKS